MAAGTVQTRPAVARPGRRLDVRALVGLFLMIVATGGSVAFWAASSDTREVLVATRELAAGSVLRLEDLAVARVRLDDRLYEAALPADSLAQVAGKALAEPVHPNQVIARAQLGDGIPLPPGQMVLSIPVSAESAVGGRVRPGNFVQVLHTTGKGKPEARTSVVLPRVAVYDVGHEQRVMAVNTTPGEASSAAPSGPVKWLALVVDQGQAVQLAQARWSGELDVALLPNEP